METGKVSRAEPLAQDTMKQDLDHVSLTGRLTIYQAPSSLPYVHHIIQFKPFWDT